jgi:hypothetical protein
VQGSPSKYAVYGSAANARKKSVHLRALGGQVRDALDILAGAPPFEGSGIEADGCRVFPIEFGAFSFKAIAHPSCQVGIGVFVEVAAAEAKLVSDNNDRPPQLIDPETRRIAREIPADAASCGLKSMWATVFATRIMPRATAVGTLTMRASASQAGSIK